MPSEKWLNTTVTISRAELGEIIANEMARVRKIARSVDTEFADGVKALLLDYSASVAVSIFAKAEDEEEEE